MVDSHGDLFRFHGVTAATPNQPEAAGTVGRQLHSEADVDAAGKAILDGMDARAVLITRGSEGVALYERGQEPFKLPAVMSNEQNVVDPNGAGDTVAAVFALAIASGGTLRDGAVLGNSPEAKSCGKFGAATLPSPELGQALRASVRAPDASARVRTMDD